MTKELTYTQFQSVKSVAKACDPILRERNALREKLESLAAAYHNCETQLNSLEAGIVSITGLHVEDLVKKVIINGVDKNGKPTKTTKYQPTDRVVYDEARKKFIITLPEPQAIEVPVTGDAGADFDIDKEKEIEPVETQVFE